MGRESSAGGGIGFGGLLCILFIALKLTGHIDWPWLWVLSPLWIPLALVFGIIGIGLVIWCLAAAIDAVLPKRKRVKADRWRRIRD
jgi:hypothetical protein